MLERLKIEDNAYSPIYIQTASNLRTHIVRGGVAVGEALPSERELCSILGISRVTVRKAIDVLVAERLLVRKHGSGTFVSPQIEAPSSYLSSFSEDAMSRGARSESHWITKSYALPTEDEALLLEIETDAKVAKLVRVRLSGGEPLAIEHAVIPATLLPDLDRLDGSLYDALAAHGNRPVSGSQKIRASLSTPTEAALLSISENTEILRLERLTRTIAGLPVELTRSVYRGDRYVFVSELRGKYAFL